MSRELSLAFDYCSSKYTIFLLVCKIDQQPKNTVNPVSVFDFISFLSRKKDTFYLSTAESKISAVKIH